MNRNGTDQKLTGYQESLPPVKAGRKPEPRRNSPKADSSYGAPSEKDGQTLPNVNRCFKDRIFRLVFSEKENLLSLYNAVSGTGYSDPDELIIYTLEDAVYLGIKNVTVHSLRVVNVTTLRDAQKCCFRSISRHNSRNFRSFCPEITSRDIWGMNCNSGMALVSCSIRS